jgi:hypothetical protein
MEALTQPYRHGAALAQQMANVPVLILACMDHGDASPRLGPVTRGASIYPAVQNLLLAARALGLGTTLTTLHRTFEAPLKELLDIPPAVEVAALVPLGYEYAPWAGVPEHLVFGRGRVRTHLVHVVEHGGPAWQRALRFRDALRADAALAAAYADLKAALALRYPAERARYTAAKAAFIERVLAGGGATTA